MNPSGFHLSLFSISFGLNDENARTFRKYTATVMIMAATKISNRLIETFVFSIEVYSRKAFERY